MTRPGFKHDVLSGFYPLFVASPGYAQLADSLASHGVTFRNTDVPTGVLLPDGRAAVLTNNRQANIDRMERISPGDGARYGASLADFQETTPLVFGMLGGRALALEQCQTLRHGRLVAGAARPGWILRPRHGQLPSMADDDLSQ